MYCFRNIQFLVQHTTPIQWVYCVELVAFAHMVTDSGMIWAINEADIQIKSPLPFFKGECDGHKSGTILTEYLLQKVYGTSISEVNL